MKPALFSVAVTYTLAAISLGIAAWTRWVITQRPFHASWAIYAALSVFSFGICLDCLCSDRPVLGLINLFIGGLNGEVAYQIRKAER